MLTIIIGIVVAIGLIFLAAYIGKGVSFFSVLAVLSLLANRGKLKRFPLFFCSKKDKPCIL